MTIDEKIMEIFDKYGAVCYVDMAKDIKELPLEVEWRPYVNVDDFTKYAKERKNKWYWIVFGYSPNKYGIVPARWYGYGFAHTRYKKVQYTAPMIFPELP